MKGGPYFVAGSIPLHVKWDYSEPGIGHGNEDYRRNENRKSRKKYFPWGEKSDKYTFFL